MRVSFWVHNILIVESYFEGWYENERQKDVLIVKSYQRWRGRETFTGIRAKPIMRPNVYNILTGRWDK